MVVQVEFIKDCLTGEMVPDIGAERNRQEILGFLTEKKGFSRDSIIPRYPLELRIGEDIYSSSIDIVVMSGQRPMLAIRCVAGSVASAEREIIAAARIACEGQIPLALATDGEEAFLFNALTGKPMSRGLDSIPSKDDLAILAETLPLLILDKDRLDRMKVIFRTYDMENVNRS